MILLQVRDLTRESIESELEFVGFVIIACPLKVDSKNVIKQIQDSSHYVRFYHVAFVKRKSLILCRK